MINAKGEIVHEPRSKSFATTIGDCVGEPVKAELVIVDFHDDAQDLDEELRIRFSSSAREKFAQQLVFIAQGELRKRGQPLEAEAAAP